MGCEEVRLSCDLIENETKNPGSIMAQGIGVLSCDVTGTLVNFFLKHVVLKMLNLRKDITMS